MNRGFSLLEVVLALLILEVGLLATAGVVLLSQENLRRAEVTLRGVMEAVWIADSLSMNSAGGSGILARPWGDLVWDPVSLPIQGFRVSAWSPLLADTVASVYGLPPVDPPGPFWPPTVPVGERW